MKRLVAVLCLSASFLLAAAVLPASAGTRNLWPSQFTPVQGNPSGSGTLLAAYEAARQNFVYLGATTASPASFESEVRLPVGKRITRLSVSAYSAYSSTVRVSLNRVRLGGPVGSAFAQIELPGSYVHDWYSFDLTPAPMVEPGYRYWVRVYIQNAAAVVYGVQVSYR